MGQGFFFVVLSAQCWKKVRDNSLSKFNSDCYLAHKFKIIYDTIISFVYNYHILSTQVNIAITFPINVKKELFSLLTL